MLFDLIEASRQRGQLARLLVEATLQDQERVERVERLSRYVLLLLVRSATLRRSLLLGSVSRELACSPREGLGENGSDAALKRHRVGAHDRGRGDIHPTTQDQRRARVGLETLLRLQQRRQRMVIGNG